MINALKGYSASRNYNLSTSNRPIRHWLLVLIATFTLISCGNQDEAAPSDSNTLAFKISDTLLGSKLNQSAGTLTITISVNGGTPQPMTISGDGLTASITLANLDLGSTDFTIDVFYDDGSSGNLQVASGTKTISVAEGSNALDFVTADFDTASFDADGDGISNIVELDEASISSPVVSLCILDTAKLDNCELGS